MQEKVNMKNVQEEWESSKNQFTDQYDFGFRIEAKEGAADHPHQPVLVNQQQEADVQKLNLKSQAVTIPKTVLQPTGCQVRCREKQDHKLSNCPKYLSLNLGQRWEVFLKRKLCQFCLEADHRCAQCPTRWKEKKCKSTTGQLTTKKRQLQLYPWK
jgi:hypothetical protein